MKILKVVSVLCLFIGLQTSSFGMENAFYVLRGIASEKTSQSLTHIAQHTNSVHIIISQAYHVNKSGVVSGRLDPKLVSFAHQHGIKLMAMVTNSNFDKAITHRFLSHPEAQQKALNTLLTMCRQHQLYGVQFDFEMMSVKDRAALTEFYRNAVNFFHRNGFIVSVAVAPAISDGPFKSNYQKKLYENYIGVYDLKALGKIADFITIMTYDQHIGRITPGPTASLPWVEAVIRHALKSIPAPKISLGIPTYSAFWYTGVSHGDHARKITLQNEAVSFKAAMNILNKARSQAHWDNVNKLYYAIFERNWLYEYIFIEDVSSFRAKVYLIKKYHLRGMSFFRVGIEDPRIWNVI